MKRYILTGCFSLIFLVCGNPAFAGIVVTNESIAANLQAALLGGGGTGISVTSFSVSNRSSGGAVSTGLYTSDGDAYGLGGSSGIVISTGNAEDYSSGLNTGTGHTTGYGVSATAAEDALLDPITGNISHNDVTQIDIEFDMLTGFDTVFFDVVFGSEEYPEYVGDIYVDGFGLFVNGTNIATVGGMPVNIDHPDFADIPETELDGVLAPGGDARMTFSQFVGDGSTGNTLTFIIADTGDSSLDSTAYINSLGGTLPGGNGTVPEPTGFAIMLGMTLTLLGRRRNSLK